MHCTGRSSTRESFPSVASSRRPFCPPATSALLEALEPRVLLSVAVDFDNYTLKSFSNQDIASTHSLADSGKTLNLSGNGWKKIDLNYNITKDTVLAFDYRSTAEGEIQGIALETDNAVSPERLFQVSGIHEYGTPTVADYGTANGTTKRYAIRVGDSLSGAINAMVFANDQDVTKPTANSTFSNIALFEQPKGSVNFRVTPPSSYSTKQDIKGTAAANADGSALTLSGNVWKKVNLPYKVTANTVIEFDFSSTAKGEVHAIGLENDTTDTAGRFFQVYGSDSWANPAPGGMYGGSGTKHYKIAVGNYFTGDVNSLVFANDHDVTSPTAKSVYSNVKIYEAGTTSTPTSPTTPTTATPTATPTVPSATYPAPLATVVVGTRTQLLSALSNAKAGTHILVKPGTYAGNLYVSGKNGTAANPIVVRAYDPANRPIISGGGEGIKLSRSSHFQIHDLIIDKASYNGLNIDDGGAYGSTHHVVLNNLQIQNVGSYGNEDGIKLSGVDDFLIRNSRISNWGDMGSGIDMVGCHRGLIVGNTIHNDNTSAGNGLQVKGGSDNVVIRGNRFVNAGERGVQIGGRTELKYFRPSVTPYEAKACTVEGNVIIGSKGGIAFINIDGSTARYNTLYNQTSYPFRILQENRDAGFVACRNGVITDNIIQYRAIYSEVNVGPNTNAASFKFARNWWYNSTNPSDSKPTLPSAETGGVYGINPQFVDIAGGDFHIKTGSAAVNYGAYALMK